MKTYTDEVRKSVSKARKRAIREEALLSQIQVAYDTLNDVLYRSKTIENAKSRARQGIDTIMLYDKVDES